MFAQPHPVAAGGLVALHDSGGERQLLIDLADATETPLTELTAASVARLETQLDPGLPAVNPLDAWGTGGADYDQQMAACLATLLSDPGAALGAVVHARGPLGRIFPEYIQYLRTAHAASGKPAFLVANHQGTGSDPGAVEATREGFPVLDGLRPFLFGVRALTAYRDFLARPRISTTVASAPALEAAESTLAATDIGEAEAMALLAAFGVPANTCSVVASAGAAVSAAQQLGYPVVLKTAEPGIAHKTEFRAVHLGLGDAQQVEAAWDDLSQRIGPRVLVAPMAPPGLEMVLGMVHDPQFGPLVMLGFGGVQLEALKDVVYALPPFDAATAKRLLMRLRQRALFDHDRGQGRPDLDAYCRAAADFSVMVASLSRSVVEIDINPLIVHPAGCVAVDALIVPAAERARNRRKAS